MVEKKFKFLRIYLIVTLAFGVIGLSDSILSLFDISSVVYGILIGLLAFLFFFFNIFALVHLMQDKLEKITWILPIYHLLTAVVLTIIGSMLVLVGLLNSGVILFFGILSSITSIFEISFSFYLLKRFKFL